MGIIDGEGGNKMKIKGKCEHCLKYKQAEEKKFISMKLKDGSEISILDGTELGVGTEPIS